MKQVAAGRRTGAPCLRLTPLPTVTFNLRSTPISVASSQASTRRLTIDACMPADTRKQEPKSGWGNDRNEMK